MRNPIQKVLDKYLEEGKIISVCEDGEKSATFVTSTDNEWTLTQLPRGEEYYCEEEEEMVDDLCYQLYDGPIPTIILCKDCLHTYLTEYWENFETTI